MARNRSWTWTVIISLLVGVVGATAFWRYGPLSGNQQGQELPAAVKGGAMEPKGMPSQAMGGRFQMLTDGKQVFVADLHHGRIWRYFHQTKEQGFSREEEGFLPISFYFAGKKHYAASEIEPPPGVPGNASPFTPEAPQPQ